MKIPDPDEYRRQWAGLDRDVRRRIVRAVNRGDTLDDRREAALAVATARRQQRFWRWAWLLGPVAALLTLATEDRSLGIYAANALLSTLILAVMSYFWLRRAQRAEANNTAAAQASKKRRRKPQPGRRDHIPGRRRP